MTSQKPLFRAALYWAPAPSDPLAQAGNHWLGRDPETGATLHQPNVPGIAPRTEAARLYGFHATLRPPMRLATGWEEFMQAATCLAAATAPFSLPPLRVGVIAGFLALVPAQPGSGLQSLADACVVATDRHRLAPSDTELARRRATGLTGEEEALLQRWGYPHVMQRWRFHMTLTDRLGTPLHTAAEQHFAPALSITRQVDEICVFTQASAEAPFLIAERLPLRGSKRVLF